MLDPELLDELFDALQNYSRIREHAIRTSITRHTGDLEKAAYRSLFRLEAGPMRSSELAEAINANPSTVSRYVAQLVDRGYVRRIADPLDGRATQLTMTEAGHARVEEMRAARREIFGRVMPDWSNEELATLTRLFGRFIAAAEVAVSPPADQVAAAASGAH